MRKREGALLVSTDIPYPYDAYASQYTGCLVPQEWRAFWRLIPLVDREGLPRALSFFDEIDICHYDSDKSYEGRMWAYPLLWAKLREGGFFISDDISDNWAFRDFCELVEQTPIIVETPRRNPLQKKYVGVLVKK